ncbi:hypothetical protein [Flavobacterium sp. NRK F7]|uniref:hypothetical protein n=1 Tax=Flavobacterium sp. NRK F7 TaxID=2954930 RepID=UPI0020901115|nr:hypothetical protein [Flavobacterium sp. NRK F7]MCO6163029.1 hypothetical protein [Flavobacterium sp. NRK F7]
MNLYLDNNIFIYLENETLKLSDLENLIENRIDKIFFSTSHIQETLEIKGKTEKQRIERINQRLNTIEKFTNNHYLNENLNNQVNKFIESPFNVIQTITEVSFTQDLMKNMVNLITEEQKKEVRKVLNIDSSKINIYSPLEVIDQLTKKLSQFGQEYTFLDMIQIGISNHKDGYTLGRSNMIAAIFELLDMLGYWKDKATAKSNYARFWDSSHTFYASFCDYFISNDKRTVNKAKVVYDLYNIDTKIIIPNI